ncbi:uncharacterized protein BJX67DRAFT_167205 [Aspergillus lucknowensis]|uniref:BZIP domain-containing protein n=1 Tax=Aspergillus lucknowensis TaxID=176173 RepID=A0ABR4M504_9EURO
MLSQENPQKTTPAEKKRLRDRRAQQNLRDKKLRHTQELEQKVAYCEEYHSDAGVQRLLQHIEGLRQQNEVLVSRQRQLSALVGSWEDAPRANGRASETAYPQAEKGNGYRWNGDSASSEAQRSSTGGIDAPNDHSPSSATDISSSRALSEPQSRSTPQSPAWSILPLHTDNFASPSTISCPWFASPDIIATSPDTPSSPLDILYGSRTNPLANMIHKRLRRRPVRDPECLALGWTIYHMSKWLFSPTPQRYATLPSFLKPTREQLELAHPMNLDFIVFPRVRVNMIRNWRVYLLPRKREDLFGLYCCCAKVRWPWGEGILERDADNELRIRADFYETFMREDGWGITAEFLRAYPDVVEGVDMAAIHYEVV